MNDAIQVRVSELGRQLISDKPLASQLPDLWLERIRYEQLTLSDLDELIDVVLANLLGQRGFQDDWSLTPMGAQIEDWIDRLNEVRMAWKDSDSE